MHCNINREGIHAYIIGCNGHKGYSVNRILGSCICECMGRVLHGRGWAVPKIPYIGMTPVWKIGKVNCQRVAALCIWSSKHGLNIGVDGDRFSCLTIASGIVFNWQYHFKIAAVNEVRVNKRVSDRDRIICCDNCSVSKVPCIVQAPDGKVLKCDFGRSAIKSFGNRKCCFWYTMNFYRPGDWLNTQTIAGGCGKSDPVSCITGTIISKCMYRILQYRTGSISKIPVPGSCIKWHIGKCYGKRVAAFKFISLEIGS